jgi:hypothetical protein
MDVITDTTLAIPARKAKWKLQPILVHNVPAKNYHDHQVTSVNTARILLCLLIVFFGVPTQELHGAEAPIVFRVTDAVKPGELVTVYGEGITPREIRVAADAIHAARPTENATMLDIVQTDPEGHFAVAQLPADLPAGSYHLWVKNSAGWSNPIKLNAARPQWLSIDRIAPGLKVKVVGRNLGGLEFGASRNTRVKLVSKPKPRTLRDDQGRRIEAELVSFENDQVTIRKDGQEFTLPLSRFSVVDRKFIADWAAKKPQGNVEGEYNAEILDINPYAVEFTVTDAVPHATYDVLVSNDGGRVWSRLESDQKLHVGPKVDDPLGLGVFWAGDFNWSRRFNVKDHRAKADGKADDTAAIQAAIDAAKKAGGGVVYLPDGSYRAAGIMLPAGVVLLGQSRENTRLAFAGSRSGNFIAAKDDGITKGLTGVARLKLGIDAENPKQVLPGNFIALGNAWGSGLKWVGFTRNRTAEKIFVKDVTVEFPRDARSGRADSLSVNAHQYVKVSGMRVRGSAAWSASMVNMYSEFSDSDFESSGRGAIAISANMYTVMERNRITFSSPLNDRVVKRGLEVTSHSYLAGNQVVDCSGSENWNEQINIEPRDGITKMYGMVASATSDTVELAPRKDGKVLYGDVTSSHQKMPEIAQQNNWSLEYIKYPQGWYLTIIDGRGLGQYRRVLSLDEKTSAARVDRPWNVIPDKTSKFVISVPALNNVAYDNDFKTGSKPLLGYQNVFDNVFADNHSENTQGYNITNYYVLNQGPHRSRVSISYFNSMVDNTTKGVASVRGTNGIGFHFFLELHQARNEDAYAYMCYGLDIRNNYVKSDLPAPQPNTRETPPVNGIYLGSFARAGRSNKAAIKGATIENNIIRDSNRGISLGGTLYPFWNRDPRPDTPPLSYGVVVKGNKFMNVERHIVDNKSRGTVLINNAAIDDRLPPVTTAEVKGQETGGVHAGEVTVALAAADDVAGVKRTEYSLDGGATWKTYGVPVVIADPGGHVMHYRSMDRVENTEPTKTLEFTIGSGAAPSPTPSTGPVPE